MKLLPKFEGPGEVKYIDNSIVYACLLTIYTWYLHNVVYKSLTTKVGQLASIDLKSWFSVEKVNEDIKLCWTNFHLFFHSIQ